MPHINIWVRKSDLASWDSIKDKPEWLHEALNRKVSLAEIVQPKQTEQAKVVVDRAVRQSIKSQNWCKLHDMEKQYCRLMKH